MPSIELICCRVDVKVCGGASPEPCCAIVNLGQDDGEPEFVEGEVGVEISHQKIYFTFKKSSAISFAQNVECFCYAALRTAAFSTTEFSYAV